jgi:hypothetical protein
LTIAGRIRGRLPRRSIHIVPEVLWAIGVIGVVTAAIYCAAGIVCGAGILFAPRSRRMADADLPSVSVLVTARNEERDLPRCLTALTALDYPADKLEIILVDDRSTDGTRALLDEAAARHPHVRALTTEGMDSALQAKSRGIALAASCARNDWLFITDADGAVHPQWLRSMIGSADPDTGILSAPFVTDTSSLVGLFERATVLPALSISFGAAGLGADVAPMGPNMAIRRDLYEQRGGLEGTDFRFAEDAALWQLARRAGQRTVAVLEPEAVVTVTPVPSLAHLVSQQRRWLAGGALGDGPAHIRAATIGIGLFAFTGTLSAVTALCAGLTTGKIGVGLIAASQLASVTGLRLRLGLRSVWRVWPVSVVYTMALFIWLPLTVFLMPVVRWRGEGYDLRLSSQGPGRPREPEAGAVEAQPETT